jgi:hypothetical protein
MNTQIRPKLYPPLALLAALPAIARDARQTPSPQYAEGLRRLVAAMID